MIIPCSKPDIEASPGQHCNCIRCANQIEKVKVMTYYNNNKYNSNVNKKHVIDFDTSLNEVPRDSISSTILPTLPLKSQPVAPITILPSKSHSVSSKSVKSKPRPIHNNYNASSYTQALQESLLEERLERDRINTETYYTNATWKMYHRIMTYRQLHAIQYYSDDANEYEDNDENDHFIGTKIKSSPPTKARTVNSSISNYNVVNDDDRTFYNNNNAQHGINQTTSGHYGNHHYVNNNDYDDNIDDYNFDDDYNTMIFDLDM